MKSFDQYSPAAQVWALQEYGRVGPRTFRALIARFGDLKGIIQAEREELESFFGAEDERIEEIYKISDHFDEAAEFLESLRDREIYAISSGEENYPNLLQEINDPPVIFFYRGAIPGQDEKTVALVGSEESGNEGIASAVALTSELAGSGVSIISGLRRGIDAAAHLAAIKAGGKSYAVLDSGFDDIHPEENRLLAVELVHGGGLISEYPPSLIHSDARDKARNRLIVGLVQTVVIADLSGLSVPALDISQFCAQVGKLLFILTPDYQISAVERGNLEKALKAGAIPVTAMEAPGMILKSLV